MVRQLVPHSWQWYGNSRPQRHTVGYGVATVRVQTQRRLTTTGTSSFVQPMIDFRLTSLGNPSIVDTRGTWCLAQRRFDSDADAFWYLTASPAFSLRATLGTPGRQAVRSATPL